MTEVSTMPLFGKNFKIYSGTNQPITFSLGM